MSAVGKNTCAGIVMIDMARTWGSHLGLALEAEQWTAENRPTRRRMKASSKERPTRRSITTLSPPESLESVRGPLEVARSMKSCHPLADEFAPVRGLKSPRAVRREQPGCAGVDPESK